MIVVLFMRAMKQIIVQSYCTWKLMTRTTSVILAYEGSVTLVPVAKHDRPLSIMPFVSQLRSCVVYIMAPVVLFQN